MGKVIHWEICKRLEFDHTDKWYKHEPEGVLENKTHKILCYFEMETGYQIQAGRSDLVLIAKKKKKKKNLTTSGP